MKKRRGGRRRGIAGSRRNGALGVAARSCSSSALDERAAAPPVRLPSCVPSQAGQQGCPCVRPVGSGAEWAELRREGLRVESRPLGAFRGAALPGGSPARARCARPQAQRRATRITALTTAAATAGAWSRMVASSLRRTHRLWWYAASMVAQRGVGTMHDISPTTSATPTRPLRCSRGAGRMTRRARLRRITSMESPAFRVRRSSHQLYCDRRAHQFGALCVRQGFEDLDGRMTEVITP